MKFDETNNLTEFRDRYWTAIWPRSMKSTPESGFRDLAVADYLPSLVFENSFENLLDYDSTPLINRKYLNVVWVVLAIYLVALLVGQRWMRNRPAFDLKTSLSLWNLFLAVFSLLGALRMVPHLIYGTFLNGHTYFLCRTISQGYSDPPVFFWLFLFTWSKYIELIDTLFLVLRKKPVGFLHAYHHVTVLAYCWYSFGHQLSSGIWFASMNYVVHAIMYFYYFLAACYKPPRWGRLVTELQLLQMFVGVCVNIAHFYYASRIENCDISYSMVYAAFVMYASYLALFAQFFVERYMRKKRDGKMASDSNAGRRHGQPSEAIPKKEQ